MEYLAHIYTIHKAHKEYARCTIYITQRVRQSKICFCWWGTKLRLPCTKWFMFLLFFSLTRMQLVHWSEFNLFIAHFIYMRTSLWTHVTYVIATTYDFHLSEIYCWFFRTRACVISLLTNFFFTLSFYLQVRTLECLFLFANYLYWLVARIRCLVWDNGKMINNDELW